MVGESEQHPIAVVQSFLLFGVSVCGVLMSPVGRFPDMARCPT
jgi:hypothetical protein